MQTGPTNLIRWFSAPMVWLAAVAILLAAAGCGTFPNEYKPNTVGSLNRPETVAWLQFSIQPLKDTIRSGDLLRFEWTVTNTGTTAVWFPKQPQVMILWIYPNGEHDNLIFEVREAEYYEPDDIFQLKPGASYRQPFGIKTYYFELTGVTEFSATCYVPRNTNPDLPPMWTGKMTSNSYGVLATR